MKKTVIIVTVIVLIFLALIGIVFINLNKEKVSITASDFKNSMEQKGYIITDANSQFSQYDYVKQVYVASSGDYSFQIEFYELSDENYAIDFYNNNTSRFEESKGNASSKTSVSWKNYSKYTLSSNGKYMVVSRINNTAIYIDVDDKYKDTVKDILNELGY